MELREKTKHPKPKGQSKQRYEGAIVQSVSGIQRGQAKYGK